MSAQTALRGVDRPSRAGADDYGARDDGPRVAAHSRREDEIPGHHRAIRLRFGTCAFPRRLRTRLSQEAQAERERRARVILGQAEVQVSDQFAQASRVYARKSRRTAFARHEHCCTRPSRRKAPWSSCLRRRLKPWGWAERWLRHRCQTTVTFVRRLDYESSVDVRHRDPDGSGGFDATCIGGRGRRLRRLITW